MNDSCFGPDFSIINRMDFTKRHGIYLWLRINSADVEPPSTFRSTKIVLSNFEPTKSRDIPNWALGFDVWCGLMYLKIGCRKLIHLFLFWLCFCDLFVGSWAPEQWGTWDGWSRRATRKCMILSNGIVEVDLSYRNGWTLLLVGNFQELDGFTWRSWMVESHPERFQASLAICFYVSMIQAPSGCIKIIHAKIPCFPFPPSKFHRSCLWSENFEGEFR